jgi:preprotein translocase subunit SecG
MKSINILFFVIAIALGYLVFRGNEKSVSEMVQDEVSTGKAAPVRSERPL